MQRYARYGPPDRYESPPGAGMCISVFALVRKRGQRDVLVGVPRPDKEWLEIWSSGWRMYTEEERSEIYDQWKVPSCYLQEEEHPEEALRRIMRDQIGVKKFKASENPRVFSYSSPSDWYPGRKHWDLVFVYDVNVESKNKPRNPKLWRELDYHGMKDLKGKDFGWNHDLVRDLEIA